MTGQDWIDKDFYKVLGVTKDADANAIKKAYRKMARQMHPDQHAGDSQAEERFKAVTEAYSVLSDADQRRQYDALRAMAAGGPRFRAGGPGASAGAGGFEDMLGGMFGPGMRRDGADMRFTASGVNAADFEEMLQGMFGAATGGPGGTGPGGAGPGSTGPGGPGGTGPGSPGGRGAGGATGGAGGFASRMGFGRRAPQPGADIFASTRLQFGQALHGATVRLKVEDKYMTVRIPAGVRDGQKIRLRGKGRPGLNGGAAGDMVVTVRVDPHPVLSIRGDDLLMTVPVSFDEAVLGATIEIPLPESGTVKLRIPAGTESGQILRVAAHGLKTPQKTGDLLVQVQVAVPVKPSAEVRSAVEALRMATVGEDPRAGLAAKVRFSSAG